MYCVGTPYQDTPVTPGSKRILLTIYLISRHAKEDPADANVARLTSLNQAKKAKLTSGKC
jgi:hypothetical protein